MILVSQSKSPSSPLKVFLPRARTRIDLGGGGGQMEYFEIEAFLLKRS